MVPGSKSFVELLPNIGCQQEEYKAWEIWLTDNFRYSYAKALKIDKCKLILIYSGESIFSYMIWYSTL